MTNHSTNPSTEVLIIGAGPSGLMLALCLGRLGAKVRIIERRLPGEVFGQADGIQPRTIELWDSLGIGKDLRSTGFRVHRTATYNAQDTQPHMGIKLTGQSSNVKASIARYPYEILAPIQVIEGILVDHLRDAGIEIEYGAIYGGLSASSSGTEVTVIHLNKQWIQDNSISQRARSISSGKVDFVEVITAKYVVGCDGSHSSIRKALDIRMEGEESGLQWGVMDFLPVTNFPTYRAKNIIQSPSGMLGYVPRPNNCARVYVSLGQDLSSRERITDLEELTRNIFFPYSMEIKDVTFRNIYGVSQRVAERFCDPESRRVYLAGEACHTHSPMNGQGANAAMGDSYNLAWKMVYVLRGWASPTLLNTYEEERRPHSLDLIKLDKDTLDLFTSAGALLSSEELALFWQRHNLFTTGLGINYASPLTVNFGIDWPTISCGQRFPSLPLIRHIDWDPWNSLDLLTYDGIFSCFVFIDKVIPEIIIFIQQFNYELANNTRIDEIIRIYVILNSEKENSLDDLPPLPSAFHLHQNVFVPDSKSDWCITRPPSPEGLMAIVRPDGYTGTVCSLAVGNILQYFSRFDLLV